MINYRLHNTDMLIESCSINENVYIHVIVILIICLFMCFFHSCFPSFCLLFFFPTFCFLSQPQGATAACHSFNIHCLICPLPHLQEPATPRQIKSTPSHLVSFSHLYLDLNKVLSSLQVFWLKLSMHCHISYACYMLYPFHPSGFNDIWWVQIMNPSGDFSLSSRTSQESLSHAEVLIW